MSVRTRKGEKQCINCLRLIHLSITDWLDRNGSARCRDGGCHSPLPATKPSATRAKAIKEADKKLRLTFAPHSINSDTRHMGLVDIVHSCNMRLARIHNAEGEHIHTLKRHLFEADGTGAFWYDRDATGREYGDAHFAFTHEQVMQWLREQKRIPPWKCDVCGHEYTVPPEDHEYANHTVGGYLETCKQPGHKPCGKCLQVCSAECVASLFWVRTEQENWQAEHHTDWMRK